MNQKSLTLPEQKPTVPEIPPDHELRWVLTCYDKEKVFITEREMKDVEAAWDGDYKKIKLNRVLLAVSNISGVYYRPLIDDRFKDIYKEEKQDEYEFDEKTGVARPKNTPCF